MAKMGSSKAKAQLNLQMDYIINGDKTEDGTLVSAYMCTPRTAASEFMNTTNMINQRSNAILAYHLKQSFKPGEVSPDEAHEIGQEFADKVLEGKYQYVVATHIDKNHIHNHIIFCATSCVTKEKYNDCNKERYRRERLNDEICREHNLSVIEQKSGKKGWRIWESDEYKRENKREIIQQMAEICMKNSSNIQEFMYQMEMAGCEVFEKNEKLLFKLKDSKNCLREGTFFTYDEETGDEILDFRCSYDGLNKYFASKNNSKKFTLTGDRNMMLAEADGKTESARTSIEKMFKTMNYLNENDISTDMEFVELENFHRSEYEKAKSAFTEKNDELKLLSMKINYAKNYWKYKKIYEESRKADEQFLTDNSESIIKFIKAKAFFDSIGVSEKELNVKGMIAEYQSKKEVVTSLKNALEESKNEYKKIIAVKMNYEMITGRKAGKKSQRSTDDFTNL